MTVTSLEPRLESRAMDLKGVLLLPAAGHDSATVSEQLTKTGAGCVRAADLSEALRTLADRRFMLCLVDLAGDGAAVAAIRAIHAEYPHLPIAGLIAPSRPLAAADAIHAGVTDLLPWPCDDRDVAALLANVRDRADVASGEAGTPVMAADGLVAHSPAMRAVLEKARAAAAGRGGVLIAGEPGTGRQHVARTIHRLSDRADAPFVVADCAGTSVEELEQRLFGLRADRPAANAKRRGVETIGRAGAVARAHGGTLVLANVSDAPGRVQAKLAQLLRDGEATLAEKRAVVDLDVRPIATAGPALDEDLAEGRIRRDFSERFAGGRIDVPPLRRRREDIPLLALQFVHETAEAATTPAARLSRSALALLSALPWPGNGRELRALMETVTASVRRPVIELDDLLEHLRLDGLAPRIDARGTLRDARARFERDWISAVLMKHHGRVGDAAKALGIQRTNLYRKVRQLNVARNLLASRKA